MDIMTGNPKRSLSGSELFTLGFGAIIGVSWIVLVGEWIKMAGPAGSTLAFAAGGLIALLLAFLYAELGSLFPEAGGELVYAFKLIGPKVAYATGWILLLLYLSLVAFEAVSVTWLIKIIFPSLGGPVLYSIGGVPIQAGDILTGVLCSLVIAWINYRGAKSAGRLQDGLTLALIVSAMIFVAVGFLNIKAEHYLPLFGSDVAEDGIKGFLTLFTVTPLFFAGFGVMIQATGEARQEVFSRLGRIMLWVIISAILFYCLVILSVAGVIPQNDLVNLEFPASQAFERVFNSRLAANSVLFVGMMGLVTTWNAVFFAALRVIEGMAARGLLSRALLQTAANSHVSARVVILVFSISVLGVLLGRTVLLPVISVGGVCVTLLFLLVACLNLIRRRKFMDLIPPYTAPGGTAMLYLAMMCSALLLLITAWVMVSKALSGAPLELFILAGWAGLGLVIWFFTTKSGPVIRKAGSSGKAG